MNKKLSGFTIIELLITVVVIATLSSISVVSYSRVQSNVRDTKRATQISMLTEALEKYYSENGEYPSCPAMSQSPEIIVSDTLKNLNKGSLTMPLDASGDSSIIADCAELTAGIDGIAYIGNSDPECLTGLGCMQYTIKYKLENSADVKVILSNRGFTGNPSQNPDVVVALNGVNVEATVAAATCDPGVVAQYRFSNRKNNGAWSVYSDWSTNLTTSQLAEDGAKYGYKAQTRCYSVVAISPVLDGTESTYIKPLLTPAPVVASAVEAGSNLNVSWTSTTCSAGASLRYRYRITTSPGLYDSGWVTTIGSNFTQPSFSKIQAYTTVVNAQCYNANVSSNWSSDANANYAYCPTGFIGVPGSATYGTSDFCIMKYEAKNVGGVPVSQWNGAPWNNANQNLAIAEMPTACTGCKLTTDYEWLTIAQNVASVPSNWSSGVVGTGFIYRGHSDMGLFSASYLPACADDSDGYCNTGNVTPSDQRRTLTLTTGAVIWDFAGNMSEWTSGQAPANSQPGPGTSFAWRQWPAMTVPGTYLPNGNPSQNGIPGSNTWTSANGIGTVYTKSNDTTLRGVRRGGNFTNGTNAGIYQVYMDTAPGSAWPDQGIGRATKS